MKQVFFFLFIFFFTAQNLSGQSKLPLIRANSKLVTIVDGDMISMTTWTLTPSAKPDVYTADRTIKTKWITFKTDIDSLRFQLKAGEKFDFVILWNGKDSCFTQVESAILPLKKRSRKEKTMHDTIPFVLEKNNAIHVKAIVNQQDTLSLHLDFSSFNVKITQDALLKKTHLLDNQPDALAGKAKPNFRKLAKVNTVAMGTILLKNPHVAATGVTARGMDGRFSWNLFEGKIMEIDYDKQMIFIHSALSKKQLKEFWKGELSFVSSFPCVKAALVLDNVRHEGLFSMDTGADKAMLLDSTWVYKQHFTTAMPLIKTTVLSDPRGNKFETKVVNCPKVMLENQVLMNVPVSLLGSKNPVGFEMNYLGNDLLKRFNTILDLRTDCIYFKPNSLLNVAYKEAS
jgi:hypothetical protein